MIYLILIIPTTLHIISHYTCLTKYVSKRKCNQHINQTTYDSVTGRVRPYFGLFLLQRNLNFDNTGVIYIDIFLTFDTTVPSSNYSIIMQAFDPGKFLVRSMADKSLLCFSV